MITVDYQTTTCPKCVRPYVAITQLWLKCRLLRALDDGDMAKALDTCEDLDRLCSDCGTELTEDEEFCQLRCYPCLHRLGKVDARGFVK